MKGTYKTYPWRVGLFFTLGLLACITLSARLWHLHVQEADFLKSQGKARAVRTIEVNAFRGLITDRNGEPLAVSTPVQSIWVNPKEVDLTHGGWQKLAKILHIEDAKLLEKIESQRSKSFLYLVRQIPPPVAHKIDQLDIPGVHFLREYRRYYPAGEVTAHIVGFTDIDHHGREGIEMAYDDWLKEVPGKQQVVKDRAGHQVEDSVNIRAVKGGQDLALSIDRRIQYLAYREISEAVIKHQAKSGSIIALDVDTGEVLALANYPSFNPNIRYRHRDAGFRNRAITDSIEPGSVMKAFSVATVLDSGQFKPDTVVDTNPGWMYVGGHIVRDIHNYGYMDIAKILQKSSNVGVTKLILALPKENLQNMLNAVGFGQLTGSNFPGENPGLLRPLSKNPFALATLAFGYGMSATPLQIVRSYAILAAGGVRRPVSFLKLDEVPMGDQVIQPHVAEAMKDMMYQTVQLSATRAQVPGYQVAGKTGTVKKSKAGGYEASKYYSLFAGFAPVENPKVAMLVIIDEPSAGQYYGGAVAAPIFSRVMQGTLAVLKVPKSKKLNNE